MEWRQGEFKITDCRAELDVEFIHRFLCDISYWAKGILYGRLD
ncbi:MAG: hypothetical protein AAF289_12805 [Cyanobacteria bacterium P01_A01_bin.135]